MARATSVRTRRAPEFRARAAAPAAAGRALRHSWRVIVADLSEARIYSANGAVTTLKLLATVRNPSARTPEHQIISGRGGSKFNRAGGRFQALAPTSRVHRERSEQFAKAIAQVAGRELAPQERLALVAAPRLLALVKNALPGGACLRLARCVSRDVTHESAARLRVRLRRELGAAPGD